MNGVVYRVTELNPRLSMEIADLLGRTGQASRNIPGGELFAAFGSGGELTGVAGALAIETDALIRFLAVREDAREKGIGSALVSRVLSFFAESAERAWILASSGSGDFFRRFGFEPAMSDKLPAGLRDSRDLESIEIAAMEIMVLELPKKWPIL